MKFYSNLSVTKKSAIWYTVATIIQKGILFLVTPVYTRFLSESNYGLFSIYQAWQSIVSIVAVIAADRCVTVGFIKFSGDRRGYLSSLQAMMTVTVLVSFLLVLAFGKISTKLFGLPMYVIAMMFIVSLMDNSLANWSWYERYEYHYKQLAAINVVFAFLTHTVGVLAVIFIPSENKGILMILSLVAVRIFLHGAIYIKVFYSGKVFYKREYWHFSFWYSAAILPHSLAQIILNSSDRLMIDKFCGREEAAYYSIAYTAASMLNIVVYALNAATLPWFFSKIQDKDFNEISKKANLFITIPGVLAVVTSLIAPYIITILAPASYTAALKCFPPVAASTFFQAVYICFSLFEGYYEKPYYLSIATITGAIANVIMNLIFIPLFGFAAAAYTTLACFMLYAFMHYVFMRMICREKLGGIKIFDTRFILFSSVLVTALSILSTLSY